jgi:copper homeostasis protein CutC
LHSESLSADPWYSRRPRGNDLSVGERLQRGTLIAEVIRRVAGRIEVLPAGGISRFTVADVTARTGCDQMHASLRMKREDRSVAARTPVSFGSAVKLPEDRYDSTSFDAVAELRGLLPR